MVIATGRDERGLIAVALHLLEAEDVTIEDERAVDVAHLQVDVADVYARIDRHVLEGTARPQARVGISLASERASRSSTGASCAWSCGDQSRTSCSSVARRTATSASKTRRPSA